MPGSQRQSGLPKTAIGLIAAAMVLAIGYLDYITGYQITFFIFYAGPILFAVWYADRDVGRLIATFSGVVWWWADWKSGHPYFYDWAQVWETVVRLSFFFFVSTAGAAMKTKQDAITAQLSTLERTRELEREIVATSESEQQRIGQDLHDGLCQSLAAISCAAASLKHDLQGRFSAEAGDAEHLEKMLRETVVQARNLARVIAPVHIDEAGLPSAITELAASVTRLAHVDCTFSGESTVSFDETQTATHLYRIAQEATNNAIKHAHPTSVAIDLRRKGESLVLTVRDDGIGWNGPVGKTVGMGMKTMQYRAHLIGATLNVMSDETGTLVSCALPPRKKAGRTSSTCV